MWLLLRVQVVSRPYIAATQLLLRLRCFWTRGWKMWHPCLGWYPSQRRLASAPFRCQPRATEDDLIGIVCSVVDRGMAGKQKTIKRDLVFFIEILCRQ